MLPLYPKTFLALAPRQSARKILLFVLLLGVLYPWRSFAQTFPTGFSQVAVATGLRNPTAMAFAPDGRLFVAEQGGKVWVIKNNALLPTPFLELNVASSGERGIIGITFDPNFTQNHYLYLYYTLPDASRNRISRFTASGDGVLAGSERLVLDLDPISAVNHNGGALHFGPAGKLYVATGDNAVPNQAQNLDTFHGKLLRINPDGSVPAGNPFPSGSEQRKRVWAYGLRNPFTFDIQPGTGRIFVNDVGQSSWEEINEATAGGRNFGWPSAEGFGTTPGLTNPLYAYSSGTGDERGCAITGGVFFNPSRTDYPAAFGGKYFFQDYCNGWISFLDLQNGVTRHPFASGLGNGGVGLEVGPDGNLYYLNRPQRALYKIVYTASSAPVITRHPEAVTVAEGQPASFAVTASGTAPLRYEWRKNGAAISGATSAVLSLPAAKAEDGGLYSVVVSNSAGSATSQGARLTVTAPNARPSASITSPAQGTLYRAGDVISFAGTGTDPEDGALPASAFNWLVIFHHGDHTHDGPPVAVGSKSGTFTIPSSGETDPNVFYKLVLVVQDAQGLTGETSVDLFPRKSTVSLATSPAGLQLTLDGQPKPTPYSTLSVQGIQRTIGVVSPQVHNGLTYAFDHWQHGGGAEQTLATPSANVTYTAVFKEKKGGLPAPWLNADVGAVGTPGSATAAAGTFTVMGAGADIWREKDGFHFVYQPLTGDGELIARVSSLGHTHDYAKAGVMMRESLAADSRNALVLVTPVKGVSFQRRVQAGGSTTVTYKSGGVPVWLKLVRKGSSFTAYSSPDGSTWQLLGSQTILMAETVYAGLALTSHQTTTLSRAVFENVLLHAARQPDVVQVLEAEQAVIFGGAVVASHAGFTGSGFVDYLRAADDYVEWTVPVRNAGTFGLEFRYALASGDRPLEIRVNGQVVNPGLSFPATGTSWTAWGTVSLTAQLQAGENRIRATATGKSGANVDHLRIVPAAVSAAQAQRLDPKSGGAAPGQLDLRVYPNPVQDKLFVQLPALPDRPQLTLTDLLGRELRPPVREIGEGLLEVSVSGLSRGIYLLRVRSEAGAAVWKVYLPE